MSPLKRTLLAGAVLGSQALAASPEACTGEACARAAAVDDSSSLISVKRHIVTQALQQAQNRSGETCPVSGDSCAHDSCCPGVPFTSGKTFPCPGSSESFSTSGCELKLPTAEQDIVQGLLGAMSRPEKYKMLRGVGWEEGTWNTIRGYYIGNSGGGLLESHGIPSLNMQDNGQGFRTVEEEIIPQVTGWPSTLAIAASWSEAGTERWAKALGKEFRKKDANVILGPGVNVHRVAKGGRNAEYVSGESPYLGYRLTKPYVKGVQSEGVLAVMKHFIANNQETNRDTVNSIVDRRTLWEVYYPPFEAAVEAGCAAAMCSYNLINGEHSCGSSQVLKQDLKQTMGFEGFIQSDWWAIHENTSAAGGVDQEMPGTSSGAQPAYFTDALLDSLSDEKINDMVARQLRMIYRFGLWKNPPCQPSGDESAPNNCFQKIYEEVATSDELKALNKELATDSVILLKNEGQVLPLSKGPETVIALVGPACDAPQDVQKQLGGWMEGSYYNIGGSGRVIAESPTTIKAGIEAMCAQEGNDCKVVHNYHPQTDTEKLASFLQTNNPTVILMCGGTTASEGADRTSLSVDDEELLTNVAKCHHNTHCHVPIVALTMIPAQTLMPWIDNVDAAMNVFLSGTYTGDAFAAALFGDTNPSAKLPITLPKSADQTIEPCTGVTCEYAEALNVGFPAYEGKEVNFPFGHGLSYTTFGYSGLQVVAAGEAEIPGPCMSAIDGISDVKMCIQAKVKNTGAKDGAEVAQLYLGFPAGAGEPAKLLRGFVRTQVLTSNPEEEVDVYFPLRQRDVQIWDATAEAWKVPSGVFHVHVGASSRDIRLEGTFGACSGTLSADKDNACEDVAAGPTSHKK